MIHAPLNKLMEKVDSRYTLVSVVAKAARGDRRASGQIGGR